MRVRHPRALADVAGNVPDAVTIGRENYAVDDEGVVDLPTDRAAEQLASAYDVDVDDLRVTDTCEVEKSDGEVCGRDLPCRYHTETEDGE